MPTSFRTEIKLPPGEPQIDYHTQMAFFGSCFSGNIGQWLAELKFGVLTNPFGVLYNPISIQNTIEILAGRQLFTADRLHHHNGLWFSFNHHGSHSHPDRRQCLDNINAGIEAGGKWLAQTDLLVLTLGSAYVHERAETGEVAANCHKLPASEFRTRLLSLPEIAEALQKSVAAYRGLVPGGRVLLTVSPVRHWKYGAVNNQLSKAGLLLAVGQVCGSLPNVHYFPAYELVMDDLRDYRFYEGDMLHPNRQAVDYIRQKFTGAHIASHHRGLMDSMAKLHAARNHRPLHPGGEKHRQFAKAQLGNIEKLAAQHPFLDLSQEREHFEQAVWQD